MEKRTSRKKIIIGVLIVLAVVLVWVIFRKKGLELQVSPVRRGHIAEYILEEAKTQLHDEYEITMPFTGKLFRPTLDVGDMVTSGQVIARIDDYKLRQHHAELLARIQELKAQLEVVARDKPKSEDIKAARLKYEQAKISMENVKKQLAVEKLKLHELELQYQRRERLLEDKVIGREEFEKTNTAYKVQLQTVSAAENRYLSAQNETEVAGLNYHKLLKLVEDNLYKQNAIKSQIEQVEKQLKVIEYDLERATIRSPVSGPIVTKYVESATTLPEGAPIYRIGDLNSIEIESDILSSDIRRVKPAQRVIIFGKALGDNEIIGSVKMIYPAGFKKISALGIEEQRNKILIEFDNSTVHLRPGLAVDIKIITGEKYNALIVPEQAVFKKDGKWYVFKVVNNRAVLCNVEVGLRNDEYAEILSGLQENDLVITELNTALSPGIKIKPELK
ncbi:efflux RND transporter periplasmic adaptor subunit [Candidatus Sumerlaeota bacterium]|nr:efflux RND transporter periplasmic adaptor subunit [Candidatus Sumerlaeota bacterium]